MNSPDSKDDRRAAAPGRGPRFWWVNHTQRYRQELEGEYLWAPKRGQGGGRNLSYDNMIRVLPGDVVFSYADGAIRAVGVALGRARETPKPSAAGQAIRVAEAGTHMAADPAPGKRARTYPRGVPPAPGTRGVPVEGLQVAVRFQELTTPLKPTDQVAQLDSTRSGRRAPRSDPQGFYLSAIPPALADSLRQLFGPELEKLIEAITLSSGGRLVEDASEEAIQQRTDIGSMEKKRLLDARHGQGFYRTSVERIEQRCRVTGLLDRRHLRARHLKPWSLCDDREKLDGFNGLLFSPHIDHLFCRGYISFTDSGELLLSSELNPAVLESWGIALPGKVGAFRPEQCGYLAYHREHLFEKPDGGRRRQGWEQGYEPDLEVAGEPAVIHP